MSNIINCNYTAASLYDFVLSVQRKEPIVQCITNFVTVNDCANILLAIGASPTMSQSPLDADDVVERVDALVCNLGALDKLEVMKLAGRRANEVGKPSVLDPIGAGGSLKRRALISELVSEVSFDVIRGNASEIRALAFGAQEATGGVDVLAKDKITDKNLSEYVKMIKSASERLGAVVVITGETDLVSDGKNVAAIRNGCSTMSKITGSGCMLTALTGAFCGASGGDFFGAACAATAVMGIAGELADVRRTENGTGNATFRNDLIDAVFNLTEEQFKERIKYEIFKG